MLLKVSSALIVFEISLNPKCKKIADAGNCGITVKLPFEQCKENGKSEARLAGTSSSACEEELEYLVEDFDYRRGYSSTCEINEDSLYDA